MPRLKPLEEISVRPKASDITVQFCGIGWLPFIEDDQGNLRPACRSAARRDAAQRERETRTSGTS